MSPYQFNTLRSFNMKSPTSLLLCSVFATVLANPASPEPICQSEVPPYSCLEPLHTQKVEYTSLSMLRCGNVSDTQRSFPCPEAQVCYDPETADVWSPRGPSPSGLCIGKPCSERPPTLPEQSQCGNGQTCVWKSEPINAGLAFKSPSDKPGEVARCLPSNPRARCDFDKDQKARCPKGWECIQSVYRSGPMGYCSHLSLAWRKIPAWHQDGTNLL
jgi:hypothetical protein